MLRSTTIAIFGLGVFAIGCSAEPQEEANTHVVTKVIKKAGDDAKNQSIEITVENGEVRAFLNGKPVPAEQLEELMGEGSFLFSAPEGKNQEGNQPRAMLGIRIAASDRGVLISEAIPGTPAARAGLREGDLIIKVNGKPATRDSLSQMIGKSKPGKSLNFIIARGDKQEKMKVKLAKWNEKQMNPPRDDGHEEEGQREARLPRGMIFELNTDADMDPEEMQRIIEHIMEEGGDEDDIHAFFMGRDDDDENRMNSHAEVVIEIDGDEGFDEEMIERMIVSQLSEQMGDDVDEEMFENILDMVMSRVHQGMENRGREDGDEDDRNHDRDGSNRRDADQDRDGRNRNRNNNNGNGAQEMFHQMHEQMEHMRRGMEEELRHVFEEMNERFNDGGEMVKRAMEEMHGQFENAGNHIRENFERFGDAMRRMHEERERIARELEDSQRRQRELSERVERLEQMLERMMQGQQPERQDRDQSQRQQRRRGGNPSPNER